MLPMLFSGSIHTDAAGYAALVKWHDECSLLEKQNIVLDFAGLDWIDANQCALLRAMIHELQESRAHDFGVNAEPILDRFKVFLQNGFLAHDDPPGDWAANTSSVCMRRFEPSASDEFFSYVADELFNQPDLKNSCADQFEITDHLMDLFANVELHARTQKPVFACGQFYPKYKRLKFSIIDLGGGYLAPIREYTSQAAHKGGRPILEAEHALQWALLDRNTTKTLTTGGMGLKRLRDYCLKTGGELHIVSDGSYLTVKTDDAGETLYHTVAVPFFTGSAVHIVFNCA